MTNNDMELVRDYAADQSEQAFETLVSRHVNLVYSAALRQARDPHLAEEITQAVFIILARKSGSLTAKTILSGWLYRTACFATKDALRERRRRQHYEQEAYMQSTPHEAEADLAWQELSPQLDEAMMCLAQSDRDALVLRFYENKSLREIGAVNGLSEEAAKKRVSRALEKLRSSFLKRGVASTTAVIAGAISANSIQAAPVGLAKTVSAAALAKGATTSTSTLTLVKGALKLMAWTKAKAAIVVGVVALLATGTTTFIVKKAAANADSTYEKIFANPDASSMGLLESVPQTLIIRPTRYPTRHQGIGGFSGKVIYDGVTLSELVAWAYGFDETRVVLPGDAPTGYFDYLNTLPGNQNDALRDEIKKRFGLVAKRETSPTDVLLLTARDPFRLASFRTKGGPFACYGTGRGDIQTRCFTNAPLSLFAEQDVEGSFEKPCILRTNPNAKYDFAFQWTVPKGLSEEALREVLKPVIEDQIQQLGLELVPTNMPIEMLVVEKATGS